MNLSDINTVKLPRKRRKRVGRGAGSGMGKTSGRGHKGQQSRSGYSRTYGHEGGQMPLFRRLPKRGFTNARFKLEYSIINLSDLKDFEADATVDLTALKTKGLVSKNTDRVKVLARGEVTRALNVQAHAFSASAARAIEAAGGKIEELGA